MNTAVEELKIKVCEANLKLAASGLIFHTFGNVSGADPQADLMAIKPSGVPYEKLKPEHIVVLAISSGEVIDGTLRPSSDTPTHLEIYRAFHGIGGVTHTHSLYATAWAQACKDIPAFGTTHADYCNGPILCTRELDDGEIKNDYEVHTGKVIVERFKGLNPLDYPGVLVASHGPFTWGKDAMDSVHNAEILEYLARLASETLKISPGLNQIKQALLEKHFTRKHGPGAYYGQPKNK